ncbi:CPBP family intramembrane glutamic endopeptidase [Pseudomonadota bacterium]
MAVTYLHGKGSIRALWARLFQWRVPGLLYGVALLAPLAAMSLALLITYFVHPDAFALGDINVVKLAVIFFILPLLDGPIGEEIGWRGFFLPLLMQRHNAIVASLIVAVVWFLWHLPHYHADGMEMSGLILAKYIIYTFALSLIHTWLFTRAQGSILIHVIFHNMANYVVLLAFTLFPAVATVALAETAYTVAMVIVAALAGLSLWRQARPKEALAIY